MIDPAIPPSRGMFQPAAALGWIAGSSQVVLLRELMVASGGGEFSLGLGLASWLVWAALGSFGGAFSLGRGRVSSSTTPSRALAPAFIGGLISLFLARLLPGWLGAGPGAGLALGQAALICLAALAPAGLGAGFGFPLLAADENRGRLPAGGLVSKLYGADSLGAAAAGLGFSLLLVHILEPMGVLLLAGLIGLLPCLPWMNRPLRTALTVLLAAGLAISPCLDKGLKAMQWQGRGLAATAESPYAQLAVTHSGGQYDFFISGLWAFSLPSQPMTERLALIPLLAHPGPKSALFLGGGSQGAAELAMKAGGIDRSTVVELDRWLFRLAGRAMGKPHAPKNLEPVFGDGRVFAANTGEKFDLVVVCQPPPSTMGSNRYYTSQGFAALARVLAKGGAAVVVWPGMEDLAGKLQVMRLASVLKAAETAFSHVDWFAGPELMILLANQPGVLPGGSGQWVDRLNRLGPGRAASVRPDTLAQGVSPLRLGLLKARLGQAGHIPANSDFRPLAVLLDPQLWGGLLGGRTDLAIAMLGLTPARLLWPLGAVIVFLAAALWMPGTGRFRLGAGVFMTGLTSMALSLMILFAYQAAFGSVYLGLALVMAGFMAGSAVAALALAPRLARLASPAAALAVTSVALALCCIGSWALAARLADAQCGLLGGFLLSAAAFIDGALTGAYFGLASGAGADQGLSGGKSAPLAGWLFGLDLAGGLLGALIPLALTASLGLKWAFVSLSVWSLAAALCPLRRA